jgi:hypothetical protein
MGCRGSQGGTAKVAPVKKFSEQQILCTLAWSQGKDAQCTAWHVPEAAESGGFCCRVVSGGTSPASTTPLLFLAPFQPLVLQRK